MAMPMAGSGGLMTLDEFIALPESEGARCELQEGAVVMSPQPKTGHQRAVQRLAQLLNAALPANFEALPECEVILASRIPATVRVPDLVVVPVMPSVARFGAADVLLTVEVLSPGSRNVDRWLKRHEYADAGIPHYWVIDIDPADGPTVTVFELDESGRNYRELDPVGGGLVVQSPFPMSIELSALTGPRS